MVFSRLVRSTLTIFRTEICQIHHTKKKNDVSPTRLLLSLHYVSAYMMVKREVSKKCKECVTMSINNRSNPLVTTIGQLSLRKGRQGNLNQLKARTIPYEQSTMCFDLFIYFRRLLLRLRRIEPPLGIIEPLLRGIEPSYSGILKPVRGSNTKPSLGNVFRRAQVILN